MEYLCCILKHIPGLPYCLWPFPTNADTVSQPVNAWKKGNAFDLGASDLTISWIGIHRKSLPFPKVIHRWSTFKSSNTATPITTTSVSELTMLIDLLPPIACRSIRVSASSWVQGAIKSVYIALLLTTFSSLVTTSMMKCWC